MRAAAVVLLATLAAGGGGRAAAEAPSAIVLVTIDTLRSDRLPAYGYDRVETPAIDALRRDGILFERAYAPSPLTLPSHASLFTGRYPSAHGVRDNLGYRLEDGDSGPTLAALLARQGYRTGAAVSSFVLRRDTGLGRGFDFYSETPVPAGRATAAEAQRAGAASLEAARPWLRAAAAGRFFFWLHLYEPHTPYAAPEPWAARYPSAYDAEIAAADAVVGALLDELRALEVYDRALVLLCSDHGEGLGDHGEDEHGVLLYREALQVPLIAKLPGKRRAGGAVAEPVSLVDVMPTVLSLVGRPADGLDGVALLAGPPPAGRPLYAETFYPRLRFGWSELLSLVRDDHQYIHGPSPELYDLRADPRQRENLLAQRLDLARDLRRRLRGFERPLEPPFEADAETRRALASLGYLGGLAAAGEGPLPDPRSRLPTLASFQRGMRALAGGDPRAAVVELGAAVELNPGLLDGWQFLGLAHRELGQTEPAVAALRRAFSLSNAAPALAPILAELLLEHGEPAEALVVVSVALDASPAERPARLLAARAQLDLDRPGDALETLARLLADDPDDPRALYLRGRAHLERDDLERAEADLRRALELAPESAEARAALATLLIESGRSEEADALLGADG